MTDIPLEILASGAVTAVGLSAAQTCAAIRAGIKRVCPIEAHILDWEEPRVGARVSADPRLRSDPATWLLNLCGRALLECRPALGPKVPLFWLVPEDHRDHPLSAGVAEGELLRMLEAHLGQTFAPGSKVLRSGAAACVEALGLARERIEAGTAPRCVIGGADSLLRRPELDRLARAGRLLGPDQPQGLVPGEGAAFMVVGPSSPPANPPGEDPQPPTVQILGLGLGYERNTALGTDYSVGDALASATATALMDASVAEPEVAFVAGNFNGERYDAWESAHSRGRAFPTRRERLPTLWSAASTGELGVAGGVMATLAAAAALADDWAAGPTGVVQLRSDEELRGVAVLARRA